MLPTVEELGSASSHGALWVTQVDVAGSAAVARVELHRDGKHVFTDYLSLYKLPDGWRIVAKTFHSH